jgi:hypothetical protein
MFKVIEGIPVWGDPDPSAVEQIRRCVAEEHSAGGALMADHPLAALTPQQRYETNGGRASYRARNRTRLNTWRRDYEVKRKAADPGYAEKRRQQVRDQQKRRREERKLIIREARSRPCVDCGIQLPPEVMDLDHVRGVKEFQVCGNRANKYVSMSKLRNEIAKCDVRCPNCHRMRHYYERMVQSSDADD